MPAPLMSRDEVIKRLAGAFRRHGYDGASLVRLSEATGLGKASLYHYFPGGKADMAAAVVDYVRTWIRDTAFAPLHEDGAPEERLNRMILALNDVYSGGHGACFIDLFSISDAESLRRAMDLMVGEFIDEFAAIAGEAGLDATTARRRGEDAVVAIQGALVVARATNNVEPYRRILAALPARLLAPAG